MGRIASTTELKDRILVLILSEINKALLETQADYDLANEIIEINTNRPVRLAFDPNNSEIESENNRAKKLIKTANKYLIKKIKATTTHLK